MKKVNVFLIILKRSCPLLQQLLQIIVSIGYILKGLRSLILLYKKVLHTGFRCIDKDALEINNATANFSRIFGFLIQVFCVP